MLLPYLAIGPGNESDTDPLVAYGGVSLLVLSVPDEEDCVVFHDTTYISPDVEAYLRHVGLEIRYEFRADPNCN